MCDKLRAYVVAWVEDIKEIVSLFHMLGEMTIERFSEDDGECSSVDRKLLGDD